MIDWPAARRGFAAVWRLAHLDPSGMRMLDTSETALWRSFQAAIIAAPFYVALVYLRSDDHPLSPDLFRAFSVEAIGYAIGWVAFPLASWYLVNALGKDQRYPGYIIAYNWSQLLQIMVLLPIEAIAATAVLPGLIVTILGLGATGAILYYQYFIVRTALGVEIFPAIGFVAMDMMIGLLLERVEAALQLLGQ
jgi:hypothetical protein